MAYFNTCRQLPVVAGEDFTGDLYKFVVIDANGRAVVNSSAQGVVDGILDEVVDALGKTTSMVIPDGGYAKVMAGAAVSRGALIASDASGRAITFVDASDNVCMGRAMQAAANAGEIITIQFVHKRTGVT